jgi:hypothetical protein
VGPAGRQPPVVEYRGGARLALVTTAGSAQDAAHQGVRGDDPLTPRVVAPRGQHCLNGCAVRATADWVPRRSLRLAGPVVAEQGAAAADRGLGLRGEAADDGAGRLDRPDQSDRLAGVHVIGVEIVRGTGPAEPFVLRG